MARGPTPTPKHELLQHLRELADQLDKTPTKKEMNEHGEYSQSPYQDRFGSWNNAIQAAGLESNRSTAVTEAELIEDYQRVADKLGKTPSQPEYREYGRYSQRWIENHFDTMGGLQTASGLEQLRKGRVETACDQCGKQYTVKASIQNDSRFCSKTCVNKWKSYAYAGENNPYDHHQIEFECEWCGDSFTRAKHEEETARFCSQDCMIEWRRREYSGAGHARWSGGKSSYRGPNWPRQRERALERDGHQCQLCDGEDDLHVHHITPYDAFESHENANQLENLTTLCQNCHVNVEWGNNSVQARLTTPFSPGKND